MTGTARNFEYNADNAQVVATDSSGGRQEMMPDSVERLFRYYDGVANRWLLYDGHRLIAETNSSATAIARRYVHGPGTDEPLVWYEGSGTTDRRWLHADERGSVIAASDGSGNLVGSINRYDDYGVPQGGSLTGRFGYTGQAWLPNLGLYDYRARFYNPALGGRFMQSDPVGYGGGMNMYAYVGNNPVNFTDPPGLQGCKNDPYASATVCGDPIDRGGPGGIGVGSHYGPVKGPSVSPSGPAEEQNVVVTGVRKASLAMQASGTGIWRRFPVFWWLDVIDYLISGSPAGDPPGWTPPRRGITYRDPPADATDPNGAKAPGLPGPREGYHPPRGGRPQWGRAPNGRGWGWVDGRGNVWIPSGPGGAAHGGPHWDVQSPGGGYTNVYPGGGRRPGR